jgi:hypothetical protein
MNILQDRSMRIYARINAIEQVDVLQYVRILDGVEHINILWTKCRECVTKHPFHNSNIWLHAFFLWKPSFKSCLR